MAGATKGIGRNLQDRGPAEDQDMKDVIKIKVILNQSPQCIPVVLARGDCRLVSKVFPVDFLETTEACKKIPIEF